MVGDRAVYRDKRGKLAALTVDYPPMSVSSLAVVERPEECVKRVARGPAVSVHERTGSFCRTTLPVRRGPVPAASRAAAGTGQTASLGAEEG